MPKVSVIVPVYNTERTLGRCLDSILAQTMESLEVVIVDDGSPDGACDIARAYADKDVRVKVVSQANAGLGAARNAGVRCAQGEYLSFVDSDDLIEPDMLYKMIEAMERAGSKCAVCEASLDVLADDELKPVGALSFSGSAATLKGEEAFSMLANQIAPVFNSMCFKVVSREAYLGIGIEFPEQHRFVEDMPVSSALLLALPEVALVHERLYHYVKSESVLSTTYSLKKAKDIHKDMTEICSYAERASYKGTMSNFKLAMLFSAIRQATWSDEGESAVLEAKFLTKEGRGLKADFRGLSIPLAQRTKMLLARWGLAVFACNILKRMKWLPPIKHLV